MEEAPDVLDVIAALTAAADAVDLWLIDGTGTVEDRLRLFQALSQLPGRLKAQAAVLSERIVPDLDAPVEVDGAWFRAGVARKIRGWDQEALRRAVTRFAMERQVDPETAEVTSPTPAEAIERMWKFVSVATGRTKVLREAGITPDEYAAEVERAPVIERVDGSTISGTGWKDETA